MRDLIIDRAEVYVVGPETPRYAWAASMPEQFMSNAILRLYTKDGLEGFAGAAMSTSHCFDTSVGETLRYLLPEVMGRSVHEREALWPRVHSLNTPLVPQAHSLIDIALWDLAAKAADMPLYRLLGGARDKILSYASTPMLASADAYVDFVGELKDQGFKAVKYHCWCDITRDMPMVRKVHARHGDSGLKFMLDVEQRYNRQDALKAARVLDELGFTWFEAPLIDTDLQGYADLRRRVDVPIIPGGNTVLDLSAIELAIRMGCWSAARVDATIAGGITPTRKILAIAEANGMTAELQCWGYTLTQAANLHLMLAYTNSGYFEQPSPYPAFEYGSLDVIRTDGEGYVHAPPGPGLGVRVDWPAVELASLLHFEIR